MRDESIFLPTGCYVAGIADREILVIELGSKVMIGIWLSFTDTMWLLHMSKSWCIRLIVLDKGQALRILSMTGKSELQFSYVYNFMYN